jgi:APA family basic amino acid/polyamine antiporter
LTALVAGSTLARAMADPRPNEPAARRIGLASATFLVVASMIGAGVFTSSGFALADLGTPERVLVAWALGGIVALCGALSYGALARALPESGGEYTFLARTLHPRAGFLAGWISLWAGFTAPIAVAALALQAYLGQSVAISADPRWMGSGAIALAACLHGVRLSPGLVAQNAVVVLKLALIGVFLVLGATALPERPPATAAAPFEVGPFAVSLVWISLSYSGWNAAVYVGGEVRDPERNLPRALLLGTLLVTVLYLALNAVFLYSTAPAELADQEAVGAIAAEALGGPGLRRVLTATVALALYTSVSSMVMAGPRVYARMAADGVFPRFFAAEGEVPRRSILLQAGLAMAAVWIAPLKDLMSYAGFTLGLCACAAVVGLFALRRRAGAARVPIPGFPLVPALYLGATLYASWYFAARVPRHALLGAATVGLGALVAVFVRLREKA